MILSHATHILITGANGQLGNECRVLSSQYPQHIFSFVSRDQLSIDDKRSVEKYFTENRVDVCINCAAYTAVDRAESDEANAYAINADAVANLAGMCKQYSSSFVHISTDYVFDGANKDGYKETDVTHPLNVYGASKLAGEQAALTVNPDAIILRTSWVYSSFGNNFVKTMMRLMQEKPQIRVVADQIGRPTYAADLAAAIFDIVLREQKVSPGIYHFANEGIISWYDFATEIKRIGGYSCEIIPIPSAEYPVPAQRPSFSILSTDKIESIGIGLQSWKESLQKCMRLLQ